MKELSPMAKAVAFLIALANEATEDEQNSSGNGSLAHSGASHGQDGRQQLNDIDAKRPTSRGGRRGQATQSRVD